VETTQKAIIYNVAKFRASYYFQQIEQEFLMFFGKSIYHRSSFLKGAAVAQFVEALR